MLFGFCVFAVRTFNFWLVWKMHLVGLKVEKPKRPRKQKLFAWNVFMVGALLNLQIIC